MHLADKLQGESLKNEQDTTRKVKPVFLKKMNVTHNRTGSYSRISFRVSPTSTKKNFGAVNIEVVSRKVVHL
jgi:hypothetical protein